jgi:hypothetical protein
MVPTSKCVQWFRILAAFLALAFMVSGTRVVLAEKLRPSNSSFPPAGLEIVMSPQEKAQHEIRVPPKQGGEKRRLSKKEKLDLCAQNPQCRASLDAANKGKRPQPIPAVTPGSPEDKAHKLPVPPKATKPKGPSGALQPESSFSLLSWLNPFSVSVAQAQTPPSGFPVRAEAPYYNVPGKLEVRLYGGLARGGDYYLYKTWPGPSTAVAGNNGRNYMPFLFTAPVQGWYIVDVEGTPARAAVNLPYNKQGVLTDFSTRPAGSIQHYVSVHYLAQGGHWFYFWINEPYSARFDAVEVDFYRF